MKHLLLLLSISVLLLIPLTTCEIYTTDNSWSRKEQIPCHPDCKCTINGSTEQKLEVFCGKGGLTDSSLHSLLGKLPKSTTRIQIIAPWFNPSNFSLTLQFLRFKRLEELYLINGGLRTLGKRVFSNLHRLHTLDVHRNKISTIYSETFENTGHIENLNLAQNNLQSGLLPTGAFSYLKNLRTLSLADNHISQFPHNLLFGLENLRTLILDGNQLNNSALAQLLTDAPHLTRLTLNRCHLHNIKPDTFATVSDLETLELGFNDYGRIPVLPIKNLPNLTVLSLVGNNISILPAYAFAGVPLKSLSLAQNELGTCYKPKAEPHPTLKSGIHPLAFANMTLVHLDISYNFYENFHSQHLGLARSTLHVLDLSGNPLRSIRPSYIQNLRLKSLHLSHIRLSKLPLRLAPEYHRLHFLNLSKNPLDTISPKIASDFSKNLHQLDISFCNFSRLPNYFYRKILGKLDTVYLHNNPWDCNCHILRLKKYLLGVRQRQKCKQLKIGQIRCRGPPELYDRLLVKVEKPPDCAVIFSASSGLTQKSELGILIASGCGFLFLVALISILACSTKICQRHGVYRTREDSKGHLSDTSSSQSESTGQQSPIPALEPSEHLF